MQQISHYESLEDALMFCIRASNKEIKEVAAALWHLDDIHLSYGRLIDALNPKKKQKLTMDEIIFIMHFCGRYDPLYYMADKCLHERPKKICIESEQMDIKANFENMLNQATKAYQHILKLTQQRDEIEKIRNGVIDFANLMERKIA